MTKNKKLSVAEIAEKIGVSPEWVYRHMKNGTLPFPWYLISVGRRVADSADIDAWLESVKIAPGNPV
jgi:predicted DNA-binding transcriptional regulator AlpA